MKRTLKFLVTKGSVTNTYPGQYNKYATNPVIVDRYSYNSNTKEYYFGLYTISFIADSDGKYVYVNYKKWIDNTHLITTSDIDTALSSTSENPVQNKVVKTAIDNLALPSVTEADNGKILKVVNGVWTAVSET